MEAIFSDAPGPRAAAQRTSWAWLGLLPFLAFAFLFMILPASSIVVGSFQTEAGAFTLANFAHLFKPSILNSYLVTIKVSATTAVLGGLLGFLIAYAISIGGLPKSLRSFMSTFSGVASNFAGVPLAFAFIATLGRVGFVTVLLRTFFGFELYDAGFNLYSFWGLTLTYTYFQIPLMILIIAPALDGMKKEWREASESLGASSLPVLAQGRYPRPPALPPRRPHPPLRQRLRRLRHRLRPHGRPHQHRAHPHRRADPRQRPP